MLTHLRSVARRGCRVLCSLLRLVVERHASPVSQRCPRLGFLLNALNGRGLERLVCRGRYIGGLQVVFVWLEAQTRGVIGALM